MPKENTHLHFARTVMESLESGIRGIIAAGTDAYQLGSVFPDAFYYTAREDIAEELHGREGSDTGDIIFSMLEASRKTRDLGFAFGYITHCALDIVFHPVIYYQSGNYYDEDPVMRESAVALHRVLETRLDIALGNSLRVHPMIRPSGVRGLAFPEVFSERFGAGARQIRRAVRSQVFYNRLFSSRTAFRALTWLGRIRIYDDPALRGLFYAGVSARGCDINASIEHRDPVTGEERSASVSELLGIAGKKAREMIVAAAAYSRGNCSREEARSVIRGESLDTGQRGVPVSAIRYSAGEGD